jgi:hypothetical protein
LEWVLLAITRSGLIEAFQQASRVGWGAQQMSGFFEGVGVGARHKNRIAAP